MPKTSPLLIHVHKSLNSKIINLQNITNNMADTFTDYKGVTKSYHPARNVSERIEVPNKIIQLPTHNYVLGKRGRSKTVKGPCLVLVIE